MKKILFAWAFNKDGGVYYAHLGYAYMNVPDRKGAIWWCKKIWKLKGPKKTKIYMLLALENKALTWEVL